MKCCCFSLLLNVVSCVRCFLPYTKPDMTELLKKAGNFSNKHFTKLFIENHFRRLLDETG